jgi:hypothetical protein
MDKNQLISEVKKLPTFEIKDVAIKTDEQYIDQTDDKAVVMLGTAKAVAFVKPRYKLVQLNEVFMPVLEGLDECTGSIIHHFGKAAMHIHPNLNEFSEDNIEYGITCINSVDKSTSIVIRFNVMVDGNLMCFPKKLAAFNKRHSGKGFKMTQDYIELLGKIKQLWKNIVVHYPTVEVTSENLEEFSTHFSVSKSTKEHIIFKLQVENKSVSLWDIVTYRLEEINDRKYTSDIHRQTALDKLCKQIYDYSLVLAI